MSEYEKWKIVIHAPDGTGRLREAVQATMRRFRERQATIAVTVVNDAEIRTLHKQFFGVSATTDVISFDLTDEFERGRTFEVIVNAEMAARQAQQRGHSAAAELMLYTIHGLLHQLGFDDAAPEQAARMHAVEDDLLGRLGCGAVYAHGERKNERDKRRG